MDRQRLQVREVLRNIAMDGVVVIGEGELDDAPMLYIGERLGTGQGPQFDIAVDPTRLMMQLLIH